MDQLESIVEYERPNLASRDRVALRDTISRIEARIFPEKLSGQTAVEGSPDRKFFLLSLIEVGLRLENTDLLLILVAQLKLAQVALVLQSTLQLSQEESKLFALSYVADYFHIEHPPIKQQLLSLNCTNCDTIFDLKSLVKLFIESNEWRKASEFSEGSPVPGAPALNRLICLKLGQQYEAMENFYEALFNYESSETQLRNSVRVVIKQFQDSSRSKLREYCLSNDSLKSFWEQLSLFLSYTSRSGEKGSHQSDHHQCVDSLESHTRSGLLRTSPKWPDLENSFVDTLPERMRRFIHESNNSKNWLNRRNIEGLISGVASLDPSTRRRLSRKASHYWQSNRLAKACASFLCLNESTVASQLSSRFLSQSEASQLNLHLCLPEASTVNLLQMIRSQGGIAATNDQLGMNGLDRVSNRNHGQWESVFFSALNLGLLDEAMNCYCDILATNEDSIKLILDKLENLVATRHSGSFDRIDPTIRAATLSILRNSLASERIPTASAISIIIYCMAIYTYKLDFVSVAPMRPLEAMFEHTSDCLREYNFNATSSLVRSTSILVTAIKDKLEIVSDSEIVRVGLGNLVETVASRCLVESQFKQAAIFYSQIEDHTSAVKSLMRLGDLDTVMNYSLLVRDITVYRLTINYLKHLEVESRIIEEFVGKSKQQQ